MNGSRPTTRTKSCGSRVSADEICAAPIHSERPVGY